MTQPSKILYIITQSEKGGAQKYVSDLATTLIRRDYQVIVTAGGKGPLLTTLAARGVDTHRFKHLGRSISPLRDLLAFFEILKFIKKEKPDVVHLNSSKAGALGAIAGKIAGVKKIIYTVHGFVFLEPMSPFKKVFYKWIERFSAKYKEKLICVSDYDRKIGIRYDIAPAEKFITINNGIDTSSLDLKPRDKARALLSEFNAEGKVYIGTIANFYGTKGLDDLIDAAKIVTDEIPETVFFILGDGQLRHSLENKISRLNLEKKVILTGSLDDVHSILPAFDMYVCSSIKEGFPYSILWSMAAGLPIVSTNVGGIPEMVGKNAVLVAPSQPEKLARNISSILRDNKKMAQLSQNIKQSVESFSLDSMIDQTISTYKK